MKQPIKFLLPVFALAMFFGEFSGAQVPQEKPVFHCAEYDQALFHMPPKPTSYIYRNTSSGDVRIVRVDVDDKKTVLLDVSFKSNQVSYKEQAADPGGAGPIFLLSTTKGVNPKVSLKANGHGSKMSIVGTVGVQKVNLNPSPLICSQN